jgi:hypothetical protein
VLPSTHADVRPSAPLARRHVCRAERDHRDSAEPRAMVSHDEPCIDSPGSVRICPEAVVGQPYSLTPSGKRRLRSRAAVSVPSPETGFFHLAWGLSERASSAACRRAPVPGTSGSRSVDQDPPSADWCRPREGPSVSSDQRRRPGRHGRDALRASRSAHRMPSNRRGRSSRRMLPSVSRSMRRASSSGTPRPPVGSR